MKADDFLHWERQIKLPYDELNEQEKESDRKETRNYLPLVSQSILNLINKMIEGCEGRKIKDEEMGINTDFGRCDAYNSALSDTISQLQEFRSFLEKELLTERD